MDKKTIMKMNDTWKDFRVNERAILFKPGFAHGFDLAGFKPGGFKKDVKNIRYSCNRKRFSHRR